MMKSHQRTLTSSRFSKGKKNAGVNVEQNPSAFCAVRILSSNEYSKKDDSFVLPLFLAFIVQNRVNARVIARVIARGIALSF